MAAPQLTAYQQGVTIISADGLNTFVQACNILADLRAFVPTGVMQVYVRGQSSVADGYQGDFYWNATLAGAPDDNVNTIIPPGVTLGGWQRLDDVGSAGGHAQTITNTATTTYTTPAYITTSTQFKFTLQGAAGGGGGCSGTANYIGGCGSAGGTVIVETTGLSPGTAYAIAVGVAGQGGATGANAGTSGGATTLTIGATTYTAAGGIGGAAGSSIAVKVTAGGAATGGTLNIPGGSGITVGNLNSGGYAQGGSCMFGAGGVAAIVSGSAAVGVVGTGYGGGGTGGFAGAGSAEAGGNGTQGFFLAEWWI